MAQALTNLRKGAGRLARSAGLRKRAGTDAQVLRRLEGGRALVQTGLGDEREMQYFFIAGFGKSGTNWVSSLLNLHPKIRCSGEFNLNCFREAMDRFAGEGGGRLGGLEPYCSIAEDACNTLIERVLTALLDENPDATHLGDRTPRPLAELLPGAPTIWLMRDPRDVIVSFTYHYLRLKPGYNISHWGDGIRDFFMLYAERFHTSPPESSFEAAKTLLAQKRWVGFVAQQWAQRTEQDLSSKENWESPLLEVRYEDLHTDAEAGLARMLNFLGLDPNQAAAVSRENNTAPGFDDENPDSFYRKGAVGDWQNYDTPAFREGFEEYAGITAEKVGYAEWTNAA